MNSFNEKNPIYSLKAPLSLAKRESGIGTHQIYRNEFMRDRGRVLYSKAFRRLAGYHLLDGARQKELASYEGVTVVNEPVVTDGNIITSYCPQTVPEVAFRLLEILTYMETANFIRIIMGYSAC